MTKALFFTALALVCAALTATIWPGGHDAIRAIMPAAIAQAAAGEERRPASADAASQPGEEEPETPGAIALTDEQIVKARIRTAPTVGGSLARHLTVPGTIIPSANRTARIPVKTTGVVTELRKGLGDRVAKGEVVAMLDSREIADAKGEYLAAIVSAGLQKTLSERDQTLWEKRYGSEQQYLRSQASYADVKVKVDAARRKLTFLGLSQAEIEALPNAPESEFERQEIRSPIAGKIVDRRVDLGAAVGRDNLETEIYSVVDLSEVWVDLAVTPGDLQLVREGQAVYVFTAATGDKGEGKIVFIGPVLDQNTRTARVVADLPNPKEFWRPGSFVTAEIRISDDPLKILAPAIAVQKVDGKPTVFVRTKDGFQARPVETGRSDDESVEITSGLEPGEVIAVENTFVLKAELGKAAAED